ncbi:MAG TPA: type II secretion system protein [Candidatus Sumerlaeota bacterium]|nr:type II secretion system protein [Candidatus Sumerlaeota bacterium]
MKPFYAPPQTDRLAAVPASSRHDGFTLLELLFIVAVISVLAAISVPNFLEAQTRSKIARTEQQIEILADALEAYQLDQGDLPPNLVTDADYFMTLARLLEPDTSATSETPQPSPPMSVGAGPGRGSSPSPGLARPVPGMYGGMFPGQSPWPLFPMANSRTLTHLTTPIAYCAQDVVRLNDSFHPRSWNDSSPVPSADSDLPTTATQKQRDLETIQRWRNWPGILYWRLDPPTSLPDEKPCALLMSYGPDAKLDCALTSAGLRLTPYDPTNGTTSDGTLFRFVPRQPGWFQLNYGPKPVPEIQPEEEGDLPEE